MIATHRRPSILVIHYSQTGQLTRIVESFLAPLSGEADIAYEFIRPVKAFPFPWKGLSFFDCMPECVQEIPEAVESPVISTGKEFDLVIFAFQPWFLSPALPVSSFLQSPGARPLLEGKPVLTLIGCRNMWLNAQEKVKRRLTGLGARLVGNIVIEDRSPNLVSVLTIIRWMFSGQKEASRWLPVAGIREEDIREMNRFAPVLKDHLLRGDWDHMQEEILEKKGVEINPSLVLLEERGHKTFSRLAAFIREKGERGNPDRLGRVIFFKYLLIISIFILSPINQLMTMLKLALNRKKVMQKVIYFKGIDLK